MPIDWKSSWKGLKQEATQQEATTMEVDRYSLQWVEGGEAGLVVAPEGQYVSYNDYHDLVAAVEGEGLGRRVDPRLKLAFCALCVIGGIVGAILAAKTFFLGVAVGAALLMIFGEVKK